MNYYAALDVSLRSVHLCVMDEKGDIRAEGQVDSEPGDIDAFLQKLGYGSFDHAVRETIEADPALSHALLPMRAAPGQRPVTGCVEKRDPRRNVNYRMP